MYSRAIRGCRIPCEKTGMENQRGFGRFSKGRREMKWAREGVYASCVLRQKVWKVKSMPNVGLWDELMEDDGLRRMMGDVRLGGCFLFIRWCTFGFFGFWWELVGWVIVCVCVVGWWLHAHTESSQLGAECVIHALSHTLPFTVRSANNFRPRKMEFQFQLRLKLHFLSE